MKFKVLVVDDSHFMRRAISHILEADGRFEVVATASDGAMAIQKAANLLPDVITMDYNMPILNGVEAVRRIVADLAIPIVMVSAHTTEGARQTVDALQAGAVDFITKPSGEVSTDISLAGDLLVERVWAAASVDHKRLVPRPRAAPILVPRVAAIGKKVVVIAVSTGGPAALSAFLPALPRRSAMALVIVQHMPAAFTGTLAERLDRIATIKVQEAKEGDRPVPGTALVAPGGRHLEFAPDGCIHLSTSEPVNGCRPSADVAMKSAAAVFGRDVVGVVMTGMGHDGTAGLVAIKQAGGATVAQDKASSLIFGMPRAAIERGVVDSVIPLDELPRHLLQMK